MSSNIVSNVGEPIIQELIPVTEHGRNALDLLLRQKHQRLLKEGKICGESDPYCVAVPRHVCYLQPGHQGNHDSKCMRSGID